MTVSIAAGRRMGVAASSVPITTRPLLPSARSSSSWAAFPEIRWDDAPVCALEKLHLEVDLEILDELGGRWLRYLQFACRVLDAAEVTDSNQQAQLLEFQARDCAIDDAIVAGGHVSSSEADALCQLLHLADYAHRSQCRALRVVR
jgi:hypothetical protein